MAIDWPLVFQGVTTVSAPLAEASWPIAVGLAAWLFREPIKQMAGRVKNLSAPGVSAQFSANEQLDHQKDAETTNSPQISSPSGNVADPMNDVVYDKLDLDLKNLLDEKVSGGDSQKLKWAIRARSISECNRIHETNYRLIFGSQIFALKTLNVAGQALLSEFENYYREHVVQNPESKDIHKNRSFEQWGQFLLDADYADHVDGSDPASVMITPFGKQFLQWMQMVGASEFKAG